MAPSLDDVQMTAEGPSDAVISYPNDGTSSGLVRGARLGQGETDAAGFRLDTSAMKPGQHEFIVLLTYTRDGSPSRMSGIVPSPSAGSRSPSNVEGVAERLIQLNRRS
jgi:hypothetical protein